MRIVTIAFQPKSKHEDRNLVGIKTFFLAIFHSKTCVNNARSPSEGRGRVLSDNVISVAIWQLVLHGPNQPQYPLIIIINYIVSGRKITHIELKIMDGLKLRTSLTSSRAPVNTYGRNGRGKRPGVIV